LLDRDNDATPLQAKAVALVHPNDDFVLVCASHGDIQLMRLGWMRRRGSNGNHPTGQCSMARLRPIAPSLFLFMHRSWSRHSAYRFDDV